jgi:hypothetical protein
MARRKKEVDLQKLASLVLIGLSNEKIATALSISHDTLTRRFKRQLQEGRADAETRLLAKAFQGALAGNVRLLELSLVNRCGWVLRPEVAISVSQHTGPPALPIAEVKAKLFALHQMIRQEALKEQDGDEPSEGSRYERDGL